MSQSILDIHVLCCTVSIYLSVVIAVTNGYCYNTDPNPYRFYTTETRYDVVLETKTSTHLNTSRIEGCEPSVFYLLARHGSRYPNSDTIRSMEETLPQYQDIIASADSMPCTEDADAIAQWQMRIEEGDGLMLAETGWQEMRDMAQRFSLSFPEVLGKDYDSSWFEFKHTESERTRDSARAFAEGLFGSFDGVEIEQLPKDGDWLLYFYENCEKYLDTVLEKMKMYESFRNGPEIAEVLGRIHNRTGIPLDSAEALDLLHDSCSFEYQVYGDSPWCASFIKEDLEVYEYAEDIQYHWTDGYGDSLNYEQTCELLKDIVHYLRLDEKEPDPAYRVLTRFAHSGALFMLYARLGLFNDGYNLTDSGYEESKDRMWRASLINPMSGNVAFVRYTCTNGEEDKVAVYENEALITLPVSGCTDGICPVSALIDEWVPITSTCDIHDICNVENSSATELTASCTALFVSLMLLII